LGVGRIVCAGVWWNCIVSSIVGCDCKNTWLFAPAAIHPFLKRAALFMDAAYTGGPHNNSGPYCCSMWPHGPTEPNGPVGPYNCSMWPWGQWAHEGQAGGRPELVHIGQVWKTRETTLQEHKLAGAMYDSCRDGCKPMSWHWICIELSHFLHCVVTLSSHTSGV